MHFDDNLRDILKAALGKPHHPADILLSCHPEERDSREDFPFLRECGRPPNQIILHLPCDVIHASWKLKTHKCRLPETHKHFSTPLHMLSWLLSVIHNKVRRACRQTDIQSR